jgi:GTPase
MTSPVKRFGTVAIVGRTNVGKSTFLNNCLGERLAIVSPLPQTTRDGLLGVLNREDAQVAFTDTPGLHRPKTELGRRMNAVALESLRSHDVVLFVTDVGRLSLTPSKRWSPDRDPDPLHPDDRALLKALAPDAPCVLMVNKVDLVRDKKRLLPLLQAFQEAFPFQTIVPTSMARGDGVERVLSSLIPLLPEGDAQYAEDILTDKPASFFAREAVREQIMRLTHREVPHAVAVTVDRFEERETLKVIQATIHVEKVGQRAILVGRKGEQIKEIGTNARVHLEELLSSKVHLELFVRVTERWKDVPRQLQEMGYDHAQGKQLANLLPAKAKAPRKPAPRKAEAPSKTTPRGGAKKRPPSAGKKPSLSAGKKPTLSAGKKRPPSAGKKRPMGASKNPSAARKAR